MLRGLEALEAEGRGYQEYIMLRTMGKGLHSSTFRVKLSRFCQRTSICNPQRLLTFSQNVDDCEPLSPGLKAWFTYATGRAGITDPLERCAVVGRCRLTPD